MAHTPTTTPMIDMMAPVPRVYDELALPLLLFCTPPLDDCVDLVACPLLPVAFEVVGWSDPWAVAVARVLVVSDDSALASLLVEPASNELPCECELVVFGDGDTVGDFVNTFAGNGASVSCELELVAGDFVSTFAGNGALVVELGEDDVLDSLEAGDVVEGDFVVVFVVVFALAEA